MPKKKSNVYLAVQEAKKKGASVSIRSIARKYGVPSSTLHDHVQKKAKRIGAGRPTILTPAEEQEIEISCQVLQEMGFGLTRETVGAIVVDYLTTIGRDNPFHGLPGPHWWRGFQSRHPKLVSRKPQHLPKHRAIAGNQATIDGFFTKVKNLLQSQKLLDVHDLADRLWNCDESGICTSVASSTVLARRGSKWVHETTGGSGREVTTIHAGGSASGRRLPPFVVYKGKHLYTSWTKGGPEGARFSVSESGWMEKANFLSWFKKIFIPAVQEFLRTGPVVLFFDGHHSHLSLKLLEEAKMWNIHLVCLPAHTSHILQPMDVGVYGPMKATWKKILKQYKTSTRAANVTKEEFPSLLSQLWTQSVCPEHISAGFRACGLHPLNSGAIPQYKIAPSVAVTNTDGSQKVASSCSSAKETPLRTELRHFFAARLQPLPNAPFIHIETSRLHT